MGNNKRRLKASRSLAGVARAEEYLSVNEAARLLGVSNRSVYAYITTGKLPGVRIGASIAVPAAAVWEYRRRVVGRPRRHTLVWHVPVALNQQYLTTITATVREGQTEHLEQKLTEIRESQQHLLSGFRSPAPNMSMTIRGQIPSLPLPYSIRQQKILTQSHNIP